MGEKSLRIHVIELIYRWVYFIRLLATNSGGIDTDVV